MHIRATKAKDLELNEHHTEIEPKVRTFTKERSANIGSTYWYGLRTYLEDWTSESSWEIIAQWHGMADGEDNTPRNPPVALAVRNGHYLLYVRADSAQATAPKDTANRYDREDTIDLGPIASNTWVDWAFKIKWDPFGTDGSISVWQNGNLIYEEYGQPNTFNDTRGPIWYMGIYKFFSGSNVSERRIRLDDIRVATVGTGDPDSPPDTPEVPAAPELLSAAAVSESSVDIAWQDNSNNEIGFEIQRLEGDSTIWEDAGAVSGDQTAYTDQELSPGTSYKYRVLSFNAAGSSAPSNNKSATTLNGVELRAFGYKKRGYHKVFLTFFGADQTAVDIYRDDNLVESTNEEAFLDEIDKRGRASYRYKVCETADSTICSPEAVIVF